MVALFYELHAPDKHYGKAVKQLKGWRMKKGQFVKQRDHFPDGLICAAFDFRKNRRFRLEAAFGGNRPTADMSAKRRVEQYAAL